MSKIESDAGQMGPIRSFGLIIRWPFLLLCCLIASQCALRPTPRDLSVYINRDIHGIAELENMALQRYGELTGDNYISDTALRDALDAEIIPVYKRFTVLAGKIKPRAEMVQNLHALYRKAAAFRLQGFRTVLLAIDSQDPDLILEANRMLDQGQNFIQQWQARQFDMAGQHGLELK